MRLVRGCSLLMTIAACAYGWEALAQSLRDPTQPPAIYAAPIGSVRLPGDAFRPEHLVIVDGVRYLVWKGRRYAVGEMIDGARIERITENEVWLRSGGGTRKLSLFSGIEKRPPRSGANSKSSTSNSQDKKNEPTK